MTQLVLERRQTDWRDLLPGKFRSGVREQESGVSDQVAEVCQRWTQIGCS